MKTSIYNNMTSNIRMIMATVLLMISATLGSAQVTNAPVAANVLVLDLGSDRVVCPGMNVFLDAGVGYVNYQWSNGSTAQTVYTNLPGCYWVRTVDMAGNIQSDTVHILNSPNPVADFAFLGATGNGADQAFANNSQNATAYLWEFGDGSFSYDANPVHSFPANGSYTICLHAYSDCSNDVFCQNIMVTWKTGTVKQHNDLASAISIAPSITNGPLTLNLGDQMDGVTNIEIISSNGTIVQNIMGSTLSNQVTLNVENQPAGLYHVVVNYNNRKISKSLVKM